MQMADLRYKQQQRAYDSYSESSYAGEDQYSRSNRNDPYVNRGGGGGGGGGADPYGFSRNDYDHYKDHDPYRRNNTSFEMENRKPHYRSDSYDSTGLSFPDSLYSNSKRSSQFIQTPPVIYELDHLATFTVSQKQRLLTAEDGMRQLRHMELTSGVWAMRIEMRIDSKEVVIIETATRKEIESFPISLISSAPVCVQSDNPKDLYNNVVIFTVQSERPARTPADMHVFQCIGASGSEVVEDIAAAQMGKFPRPPPVKEKVFSPPAAASIKPLEQPSTLPLAPAAVIPVTTNVAASQNNTSDRASTKTSQAEDPEHLAEQLDRCIDDIERFVAELQQAANDQKDMNRQSKNMSPADLEEMKKRNSYSAPSTKDFVAIFQKFRYAFNLLPKLAGVMREPTAGELAVQLFAPFSEILKASVDGQGQFKLANSVVSPLLNLETCKLLEKSLSRKDTDLWQSLDVSWTTPAERWSGQPVATYTPTFGQNGSSSSNGVDEVQLKYKTELQERNCKICQVQANRTRSNAKELSVLTGEYLEVLNDEKNWWRVSNVRGESGFVPKTILKQIHGF